MFFPINNLLIIIPLKTKIFIHHNRRTSVARL